LRPHNNENANAAATQHPTPSKISHNQMEKSLQKPHTHKVPSKLSDNQMPKSLKKKQQDTQSAFEKHSLTIKGQNLSKNSKQHTHKVHSKLSNKQKKISTTTASADYLQINKTQRKDKEGIKKKE
jgi:hypothetical protein